MSARKYIESAGIFALALAACLSITACGTQKSAVPPANVTLQKDLVYANVAGLALRMDIARPKQLTGNLPVVICIHGGAWAVGSKTDMLPFAYAMAALGFEAAAIDYRLVPAFKFPAQIDDVRAALAYLCSHAKELKIDPARVAAVGGSAGGHLSLLLAESAVGRDSAPVHTGQPGALCAAVSISGPTDLLADDLPAHSKSLVKSLMGLARENNLKAFQQASPIYCLKANCPPLLLVYGDKDEVVPYSQATSMLAACEKKGVPAELFTLHNAGHSGGGDPQEREKSVRKLEQFLALHLKQ